jgi:hypothetical protein
MEQTNPYFTQVRDKFDDARTWLQIRQSSLELNSVTRIVILSIIVAMLAAGTVIAGLQQAHLPFVRVASISPAISGVAQFINRFGFLALVAFSYFTNLSGDNDQRRELIVDGVVLALGFLAAQFMYQVAWLATTFHIVTANNYIVTSEMFVNINIKWLLGVGLATACFGLIWYLWRTIKSTNAVPVPEQRSQRMYS